jgi:hypothetical protein
MFASATDPGETFKDLARQVGPDIYEAWLRRRNPNNSPFWPQWLRWLDEVRNEVKHVIP